LQFFTLIDKILCAMTNFREIRLFSVVTQLFVTAALWAQTTVPSAGLQYVTNITVPNWTETGTNQANFDLFAFNPLTRIMYMADRTNKSVGSIDTRSNTYVGTSILPTGGSTNGVVIAPDLQQLVVTDGKANIIVYDLRVPGTQAAVYAVPNITSGTDALDYNPINHTVYVINGTAPYYITGVDLVNNAISTQLQLPASPELMKFNPVDGMIYQVFTDGDNHNAGAGVAQYNPYTNTLAPTWPVPCVPHGIDIDPVTDTALIGCGTSNPSVPGSSGGQILMDLRTGTILNSFPDVNGTDLLNFNSNNRRWYTGSSSNSSTTTGCPADSGNNKPVVGVFDPKGASPNIGELVGVLCAGRDAHGLGIDTIQNNIYVGSRQYPSDPNSSTTGVVGVQVYNDPAPPTQRPTILSQAVVTTLGGNGATASVSFEPQGRSIRVDGTAVNIPGSTALLSIATTVGSESVWCSVTNGSGTCSGVLVGDPLIGGPVLLASDGKPVGSGTIYAEE
jgi:hypothetical protein